MYYYLCRQTNTTPFRVVGNKVLNCYNSVEVRILKLNLISNVFNFMFSSFLGDIYICKCHTFSSKQPNRLSDCIYQSTQVRGGREKLAAKSSGWFFKQGSVLILDYLFHIPV